MNEKNNSSLALRFLLDKHRPTIFNSRFLLPFLPLLRKQRQRGRQMSFPLEERRNSSREKGRRG